MTTIACNKEEIACDLQFTEGTNKWKGKTKIYKFKANELTYPHADFYVGFAGTASDIISVLDFFSNPASYGKPPKAGCSGLILTFDGDIFAFDHYAKWLAIDQQYAAIGSGMGIALGSMVQGASPKDAVRAAMKHDAFTGFGVKNFKIK